MKKKIALITGASGGIGGACAETLARAGYTVLLHGCHGLEHAKALADRLCAEGCDAHAVCCDLADSESAQAMCPRHSRPVSSRGRAGAVRGRFAYRAFLRYDG